MSEQDTSTNLATLADFNIADLDIGGSEALAVAESVSKTPYLPRLGLSQATTSAVVEGSIQAGYFFLDFGNKKLVNLGRETLFVALGLRAKALKLPENKGAPISYYDAKSENFKKVQAAAALGGMNGNMYGPEFLAWVPDQQVFGLMFCANKTMRNVAPGIIQLMKRTGADGIAVAAPAPISLKAKLIEGPKNKWWGCEVFPYQGQITSPVDPNWKELLDIELKKFRNPPESEIEEIKPEEATGRVR